MDDSQHVTADDLLRSREENWPAAAGPVVDLVVRILRLGDIIRTNATRLVDDHALTFTEFEVLVTLRGAPPPHELAPTDLYGALLISSGGLTKVLRGLETRHLIRRSEDDTDRRSKPVRLTERGHALAERVMAEVIDDDRRLITSGLSETEAERLNRHLRKLLRALETPAKTE